MDQTLEFLEAVHKNEEIPILQQNHGKINEKYREVSNINNKIADALDTEDYETAATLKIEKDILLQEKQ